MEFKNLKDKCLYYRGLTDYRLMPQSHVICMVDGRSFSKLIKNKFEKPFDAEFIRIMNESAKYVCENVEGCKMAYVQSDEVSFYITDISKEPGKSADAFFGFRLTKMQSIIASMMASKFNQLMMINLAKTPASQNNIIEMLEGYKCAEFDCKCWTVPNENDAYAWFLYRQLDCIKNAKQAVAQKVCSHKQLEGLNTDEQIAMARANGLDYDTFSNGEKYGRIIYRYPVVSTKEINGNIVTFERNPFTVFQATPFNEHDGEELTRKIIAQDIIVNI